MKNPKILCAKFSFSFVLSWKVNSGEDETHGVCVEDFWAKASSVSIEEFSFEGARNEDYSFDIQSVNPRSMVKLYLKIMSQIALKPPQSICCYLWTCWSDPEDYFSLMFSLKILKLKELSFKNLFKKPPHPTCVQCQILKKNPTAQDEFIYWRFICLSWCCEEIWRLMLKPSSQWRLTRKSQLLFRGSLLGQLEKKAINQGGDCWVKNMVYTLLF